MLPTLEITPHALVRWVKNYANIYKRGILNTETYKQLSETHQALKPRVENAIREIKNLNQLAREIHATCHEALLKYSELERMTTPCQLEQTP